jgi:hypothetical protein
MPARNPEAVRQRAIAAARQRSGQPATPPLDPVFVALNPVALPARERSAAELYQWVRREEQYANLGANVVVELYSESHAPRPTTRVWAIVRRAERSHRLADQRTRRGDRRHPDRAGRSDRTSPSHHPEERGWLRMLDDQLIPTSWIANRGSARPCGIWPEPKLRMNCGGWCCPGSIRPSSRADGEAASYPISLRPGASRLVSRAIPRASGSGPAGHGESDPRPGAPRTWEAPSTALKS